MNTTIMQRDAAALKRLVEKGDHRGVSLWYGRHPNTSPAEIMALFSPSKSKCATQPRERLRPRHRKKQPQHRQPDVPMEPTHVLHFDGACEPRNPGGAMGMGWVLGDRSGHRFAPAANSNTNNVAEYLALIEGLKAALASNETGALLIRGDSRLVIEQMSRRWRIKSQHLVPLAEQAHQLIQQLRERGWQTALEWVPRDQNQAADDASKAALLEHGIQPAQRANNEVNHV